MAELEATAAPCQHCNTLTTRKCSVCSVCTYCSTECEAKAATHSFAGVACKLHLAWPREETNLGNAGAHFLMLPSVANPLTTNALSHMRWTALHQAAVHYLHVLLACSSSKVFHKTAFGMAIVPTPGRLPWSPTQHGYSCGFQRLNFPVGKTSQATTMMVGNMAKLALAQLGEERIGSPQLRDSGARDNRQAVILSGVVSCSVVHFDSIYLTHTNDTWTIERVQPLWEQDLTPLEDKYYSMDFKPKGRVPPHTKHPLQLLEQALSPPRVTAPTPAPTPAPPPSPSEAPPVATAAPLRPDPAMEGAQEEARKAPRATPRTTAPPNLKPWEAYRAQAQALAEAQTEPPLWLHQLAAALQKA